MFDIENFTQFGIAGLILFVFAGMMYLILQMNSKTVKGIVDRMSTDHKDSNDAWRSTFEMHSGRADIRQQETNQVLRDLANIMSETNHNVKHTSAKIN